MDEEAEPLRCRLSFGVEFSTIAEPDAKTAYEAMIQRRIAGALGLPIEAITIRGCEPGSIVVRFKVQPVVGGLLDTDLEQLLRQRLAEGLLDDILVNQDTLVVDDDPTPPHLPVAAAPPPPTSPSRSPQPQRIVEPEPEIPRSPQDIPRRPGRRFSRDPVPKIALRPIRPRSPSPETNKPAAPRPKLRAEEVLLLNQLPLAISAFARSQRHDTAQQVIRKDDEAVAGDSPYKRYLKKKSAASNRIVSGQQQVESRKPSATKLKLHWDDQPNP